MKRITCTLAALSLLLGAASNQVLAQTGKTDPTLSKMAKEYMTAFNAKDAAKVAALYAEDAVLSVPNEPAARGRKAVQAWAQKNIDQGVGNLVLTPTESAISGNVAYETGTYSITIAAPGQKPATDKGKYMLVLKQAGGKWLIAHDMYNSDLPPPPPPPSK
jgi:uncharacterized protein (TIGR02246 family)